MKELDKNKIYSLEGLSEEQLRELAEKMKESSLNKYNYDLDNKCCIVFVKSDWFKSYLHKPTAKAIDLFKEETQSDFKTITDSIASLLEYKNGKYGNAALEPLNIFTNKTQVGQRIDDKLARIKNSDELRKNDVADLIGYLLLECKFRGWNNFDEFKD